MQELDKIEYEKLCHFVKNITEYESTKGIYDKENEEILFDTLKEAIIFYRRNIEVKRFYENFIRSNKIDYGSRNN